MPGDLILKWSVPLVQDRQKNMNVVLIDKHPVFRTGIRVMLKSQFEDMTTLETACMHSLGKVTQPTPIDIIIIGLSEEQPEIDKVVLKRVMRMNPLASFIIYASYPRYELAQSLLRIGVKGYLTKNGCPEDLVTCMQSVIAGKSYVCRQVQATAAAKLKRIPARLSLA